MKQLIDMADVDNLIISAIELTDCDLDNRSGPQSGLWMKVYEALNLLRSKTVDLHTVAQQEGYVLKSIDDALYTSER